MSRKIVRYHEITVLSGESGVGSREGGCSRDKILVV